MPPWSKSYAALLHFLAYPVDSGGHTYFLGNCFGGFRDLGSLSIGNRDTDLGIR